jgi:quinoprotein glucose dehydrogenase
MTATAKLQRPRWRTGTAIFSGLLGALGLSLLAGGLQLLLLGGSPYYGVAGLMMLASAWFTWRAQPLGAWIYAVLLLGSTAWAIWESQWNGWAVAARLLALFTLALGFLIPGARGLATRSLPSLIPTWARGWRAFALGLGVAILLGALASTIEDAPIDPVYQTGVQSEFPVGLTAASLAQGDGDWVQYGNDSAGTRYSPLGQIRPDNVRQLELAWTVDLGPGPNGRFTQLEVTPIKINRSLYVCTAYNDVLSIDAETGHVNWRFRSGNQLRQAAHANCRGVAYY